MINCYAYFKYKVKAYRVKRNYITTMCESSGKYMKHSKILLQWQNLKGWKKVLSIWVVDLVLFGDERGKVKKKKTLGHVPMHSLVVIPYRYPHEKFHWCTSKMSSGWKTARSNQALQRLAVMEV
jgi:hypothetical protein